jgi:hypothetical protein
VTSPIFLRPVLIALKPKRAHCYLLASRGCKSEAAPAPVDTSPSARVAGTMSQIFFL